jgi:hypothetical protein
VEGSVRTGLCRMTDNATHNGFRLGFGMRKFEFQEFREKMIRTILGPFLMAFFAMIGSTWASVSASAQSISADEARTIAKEVADVKTSS